MSVTPRKYLTRRRWHPRFKQCKPCYDSGVTLRESLRYCGSCLLREKARSL